MGREYWYCDDVIFLILNIFNCGICILLYTEALNKRESLMIVGNVYFILCEMYGTLVLWPTIWAAQRDGLDEGSQPKFFV